MVGRMAVYKLYVIDTTLQIFPPREQIDPRVKFEFQLH